MPHPTGEAWRKTHYAALCKANKARIGKLRRFSEKRSKTIKKLWTTKAYGDRLRKKQKERMADPRQLAKWLACVLAPEVRTRQAAGMREFWADPVNYERMCQVRKDQVTDAVRANLSAEQERRWDDPDYRRKMVSKRREQVTPRSRKAISARLKALWADPVYRAKQMSGRKVKMYDNPVWRSNIAAANKKNKTGKPSWNKGLTKATDSRLLAMSLASRGQVPKYGKWKCWYPSVVQKEICMRSSWEVAFGNWLDDCDIRWEYETRSFNIGQGSWKGWTYTPDFYLPDQNEFVELKGHMSEADAAKIKRFHKLYPDVVLHLVMGKELKQIRREYGRKGS